MHTANKKLSNEIIKLEELVVEDIATIEFELAQIPPASPATPAKQQHKRAPLPPHHPRTLIHHEPDNTQYSCGCQLKRIGEEVSEQLDYTPGTFTVEHHIRGKWACAQCERLIQAPVPPHIIDKGIPTTGLLAQVLVARYADHLSLYRQEGIFARAGLALPRSTWAPAAYSCMRDPRQPVIHADEESPVPCLSTQKASAIDKLLPYNWKPITSGNV